MKTKLLGILIISLLISSWGFLGHRNIHSLAIDQLNGQLKTLFLANKDYLVEESVRPDKRRKLDKSEAAKHYLDLDAEVFGENYRESIPRNKTKAIEKFGREVFEKEGMVQWVVPEIYQKLVRAFRKNQKDSILFYAADLGHYVADAHVPLHTTKNYNGQFTNQKGLHALWESLALQKLKTKNPNEFKFQKSNLQAYIIKDVNEEIWKIILESNALVNTVLSSEKLLSKDFSQERKFRIVVKNGKVRQFYSKEFIEAFAKKNETMILNRMHQSAQRVASFWMTAYAESQKK